MASADPVAVQIHRRASVEHGGAYPPETIPALASFLDELAERGVRYLLWKSNLHLTEALAGLTDLDLLVDREHALAFREVVGLHRLRPLVPPPGGAHPGMEHFLGLDKASGRLFHLHVHYQLVLGERYVKNYRVPMERHFLDSTRLLRGVPVPSVELELSVLAVRALLKYRARDVVKDVLRIRSPGIPAQIRAEMAWLLDQTTVERVRETLRAGGNVVPPHLACGLLETVTREPRSGLALLRLRTRARRALREFQRHGRLAATVEYVETAWNRRKRLRRRPPDALMTPAGGGLTVALIGADGSGKSTLVDELARWLRWKLEVRVYYMGSKEPSRRSRMLYLAYRALRRGHRTMVRRFGPESRAARPVGVVRDVTLALHHLSIGRDRASRYHAGRGDAQSGRVVIYDRFPLESLSPQPEHRLLDGPQIAASLGDSLGGLRGALAEIEERMYRTFRLPDQIVVLQVSPQVSVVRKPDHHLDVLAAKSRAAEELATLAEGRGRPVGVIRIDADRPLDEVLLALKARLWDVL
jgi:energy-coupling factor transporter ATP-binding protein EcfA2